MTTDVFRQLRELIRRAILTHNAIKDREAAWLTYRSWFPVVNEATESYGYNQAVIKFVPSAADVSLMEEVFDWLAWVRWECGELALWRLWRFATGIPTLQLAERENCTERTIRNRVDRTLSDIVRQFGGVSISVQTVVDSKEATVTSFMTARPVSAGRLAHPARVWIGGEGFMKGSRRLRTGQERLDDRLFR